VTCDCQTVKNYDGEYHCMQCYRLFIPAQSAEDRLRDDYTPIGDDDYAERKHYRVSWTGFLRNWLKSRKQRSRKESS